MKKFIPVAIILISSAIILLSINNLSRPSYAKSSNSQDLLVEALNREIAAKNNQIAAQEKLIQSLNRLHEQDTKSIAMYEQLTHAQQNTIAVKSKTIALYQKSSR